MDSQQIDLEKTSPCILVVEDNDDVRMLYEQAMTGEGYRTILAANGEEALHVLRDTGCKPDLILLDLMMPVMDGWTFLQERSKYPDLSAIPVVICSASRDSVPPEIRSLRKPVDLNALLEVAEEFCV